jgi:hypothetical protein
MVAMNVSTLSRAALSVLAILTMSSAVRADHGDRVYDQIELFAKVGTDQSRDLYKDIIRQVDEPGLRAQMMTEARQAMVGFAQIRAYAKQERVERMGGEVQQVFASLQRLDRLTQDLAYGGGSRWDSFRREPPDVRHMRRVVASLTNRILIIDDLSQQVYGPPEYRYQPVLGPANGVQTNYTSNRPGFVAPPSGAIFGEREFEPSMRTR